VTITSASVFASTLPGRYYTDPAVFELEKQNIFGRQWMYACRAEDLPAPGRFVRTQLGDESVIVVRGRDRVLRAFLNVCRHRGSRLCRADSGDVGRAIRCPYHAWGYQLDGRLIATPNWRSAGTFDKAGYSLHPVHLAEWHGLVWLNLAADPEPLAGQLWSQLDHRLGGDRAKFARYGVADLVLGRRVSYDVAANWKIIQENFQECYHCGTIHPELVDTVPAFGRLAGGSTAGYDTGGYLFADGKASFSVTGTARLPRIPGLEAGDDRKYYGMILRPNCAISLLPDHVIVHRFEMVSPDTTRVVCEWLFPPQTIAAGYDIDDTVELFHRINAQDFTASEGCQPNMRSRAYRDGGVLVPAEQEVIGRWYYRWYRAAMGLPEQP
jgi:glycine betaine catabolism A